MVKILLLFEEERVIALQVADGTKNYTNADHPIPVMQRVAGVETGRVLSLNLLCTAEDIADRDPCAALEFSALVRPLIGAITIAAGC